MKQELLISIMIILNGLNAQNIVLEFNSGDDAIIVENDQLPSGSDPRTIEAWVYPENSDGHYNVAYYGGDGCCGKHFGIRATTATVYAFVGGAQRGITNIDLDGWHHVAFVLPENEDRTYKIKVFLDGVEETINHTVGGNYLMATEGSVLEIGGNGFTGQIKQLRIWSTDLSEEEISANKDIAYISSDHDNYDKLVYQLQEEEELEDVVENDDYIIYDEINDTSDRDDIQTVTVGDNLFGGYVIYVDETGYDGYVVASQSVGSAPWGCVNEDFDGARDEAFGGGEQNTLDILDGCSDESSAASIIANLEYNGYDDWFLPSKYEMLEIYNSVAEGSNTPLIEIDGGLYWTSNKSNDNINALSFEPSQLRSRWSTRDKTYNLLPIRKFTQKVNVGDNRFGGYIIYVDETGYDGFVVASQAVGSAPWGCVNEDFGGASDEAFGGGEQNTLDILDGCSDESSAASIIANLEYNGYDDWFLPSKYEMLEIYNSVAEGSNTPLIEIDGGLYWTSNKSNDNINALSFEPSQLRSRWSTRNKTYSLLPIRKF